MYSLMPSRSVQSNAKSNAGSSWGEKDKMESDEHLKVPKESDTWSNLPQKTPGVIWLQHQWAIKMLSNSDVVFNTLASDISCSSVDLELGA